MNFEGFDEETIAFIHRVIDRFQHFRFAPDAEDWKWLQIHGACFDTPEYDYFVMSLGKGRFDVQVCPLCPGCRICPAGCALCYKFGIWFDRTKGELETQPYHNGHLS